MVLPKGCIACFTQSKIVVFEFTNEHDATVYAISNQQGRAVQLQAKTKTLYYVKVAANLGD